MMQGLKGFLMICGAAMFVAGAARGDVYELVTGVAPNTSPGAARTVFPSGWPATGVPGALEDGQRLGGTPSAAPVSFNGAGTPMFDPNQFGSLSFMFRRGSAPTPVGPGPLISIDYLGGPLLDLDGDPNNASRSLTPVIGQTPATIPGSRGFVDLGFDTPGTVTLNDFDATANNAGFTNISAEFATTVNTIAGTQPDGSQTGSINPGVDTRQGTVTPTGIPGVSRITDLGYEIWQDSISENSSTADTLGTLQYLGSMRGYLIQRDGNGNFPTLAGQGLGTTLWPLVNSTQVGGTFNTASGPNPLASIGDGPGGDLYSAAGNGGLALADFNGDLGEYLDAVVVPNIASFADSFVYLEAAGFGINNSVDPVFDDTSAYDLVLIGQRVPEPGALSLLAVGGLFAFSRRYRR